MYNEDLKRRFLSDHQDSKSITKVGEWLFGAIEPFELKYGTDFCSMSLENAKDSISGLFGIRASSAFSKISILRTYVQWCIDNGVEGANPELLSLKREGNATIYSQTITDPSALQRFLDALFDEVRIQTSDCLIRVYLWFAFAGLEDDEAVQITVNDVDLKNKRVTFQDREYKLYEESISAVRACLKPNFNRFGRNNWASHDRVSGNKLLRGIRTDANMAQLRNVLVRKNKAAFENKKTDKRLSYFRVWISGVFYRMYLWEQSGNIVDFTDVAAMHLAHGESNNAYNFKTPAERKYKLRQLKRDFAVDYSRWKEAYNL